jgi:hypothetical protein
LVAALQADLINEELRRREHYLNTLAFLKQHCPDHYASELPVYENDLRAWDEWIAQHAPGRVAPGAMPP